MLGKRHLQEFIPIYKKLDRAIEKRSVKELEEIKKELIKMGASSSFKFNEGIDNLIKGLKILYEED